MRVKQALRGGIAALFLAGLAACSGGSDAPTEVVQLTTALREAVAARVAGAQPAARPQLTRAMLKGIEGAYLEATLEKNGKWAYLPVEGMRPDDGNGAVTVWRTVDEVSLITRNGVLVGTRGLGGDILSTEIDLPAGRAGPPEGGVRVLHVRDSNDATVPVTLACSVRDLGSETVEIVELRHATRHLRETCDGGGGRVVNDYWIDPRRPIVWQSRQWAGPHNGYLRLRQITE